MSKWKDRLVVLGALAGCVIAAKAMRQLLLWSQISLLPPNIRKFKGEWALVTGGSEGVGRAIAGELAGHGLHVLLVSRSQAKLDAAAKAISSTNSAVQVRTYAADLTDRSSLQALLQHLFDTNTQVSVLVANAGGAVPRMAHYWEFSEDEETAMQNLNGRACYFLVKGMLPAMLQRGRGAVVAISSSAHRMSAYLAPYGAEKAKLNALFAALDTELHGSGVTAQAMVLGAVITPGLASFNLAPSTTPSSSSSSSNSSSSAADSADALSGMKPTFSMPTAETAAAAVVRSIGKGGPVVTPYWGHQLLEWLVFDCLWPPALARAVQRAASRQIKATWEAKNAAEQLDRAHCSQQHQQQ